MDGSARPTSKNCLLLCRVASAQPKMWCAPALRHTTGYDSWIAEPGSAPDVAKIKSWKFRPANYQTYLHPMLIGTMNHPGRDLFDEIAWTAGAGFDFIDLTLEPPLAAARN